MLFGLRRRLVEFYLIMNIVKEIIFKIFFIVVKYIRNNYVYIKFFKSIICKYILYRKVYINKRKGIGVFFNLNEEKRRIYICREREKI